MGETRLRWGGSIEAQRQADEAFAAIQKPKTKKLSAKSDRPRRVSYKRYIMSRAWKSKRALAIAYYENTCHRCGGSFDESQIHVHHRHYKSVGREKMTDLEVLCRHCHCDHHGVPVAMDREFQAIISLSA